MDLDERSDSDRRTKNGLQLFELLVTRLYDFSMAVEAHDFWRPGERAKHQDDAFVFSHVRDGLYAAPSQVQIDDRSFIDDSEGFAVFWRTVHVARRRKRRGRHEKDSLRRKPSFQLFVDRFVDFSHTSRRETACRRMRNL